MNDILKAAEKYAFGRCSRGSVGPDMKGSYVKGIIATFLAGAAWQREQYAVQITDMQREFDKLVNELRALICAQTSDVSTRPETGEGHTGPCREGCKCMGPARAQDDCDFYKGLLCNCKKAHSQDALDKKDYIAGKQAQNADAWIKCPCGTMYHHKDSPTWVCPDCRDNAQQEVTGGKKS